MDKDQTIQRQGGRAFTRRNTRQRVLERHPSHDRGFPEASEFKLPELIGINTVESGEGVLLRLDTLKALFS